MFAVIWRDRLSTRSRTPTFKPTRDAVERAVTRLNHALASDPANLGESRPGRGRRIAHDAPCAIRFTVDAAGVRVTQFWTY